MSSFKPIYKLKDWININQLNWNSLSENSNAIHLLEQNPDKINWFHLSENCNDDVIKLLEQNPDKINWFHLSRNRNAIKLLEQNPDKINWENLSYNANAIHLLEQNPDKIEWVYLSTIPSIFKLDIDAMRLQIKDFAEDLAKTCFHPNRVERYLKEYDYEL